MPKSHVGKSISDERIVRWRSISCLACEQCALGELRTIKGLLKELLRAIQKAPLEARMEPTLIPPVRAPIVLPKPILTPNPTVPLPFPKGLLVPRSPGEAIEIAIKILDDRIDHKKIDECILKNQFPQSPDKRLKVVLVHAKKTREVRKKFTARIRTKHLR